MVKVLKITKLTNYYLEAIVGHPISEFGEFTMYISKNHETKDYVFSIPSRNWLYITKPGIKINVEFVPSGFNHPRIKGQLIEAMNKFITLI